MRRAVRFGSIALVLLLAPAALAANSPPKLTPIKAVLVQKAFATNYTASATDPDGDKLTRTWTLAAPTQDPKRNKFATVSPTPAVWHHGQSGSGKPPATLSHSDAKAGTYGGYLVVAHSSSTAASRTSSRAAGWPSR